MIAHAGVIRRMIVAVLVIALVGAMILIDSETSTAARIRTKATLKVTDKTVRPKQRILFFGKVKSPRGKCRRNRVVLLKRKGTGTVKRDRSDREGEFRFRINPKPDRGTYFVKVKSKRIRRPGYGYYGYGGGRDTCRSDTSKRIRIRPRPRP
jgi:hypothetical protein